MNKFFKKIVNKLKCYAKETKLFLYDDIWLGYVYFKPYWLIPLRIVGVFITILHEIGGIQIHIPSLPLPFKTDDDFKNCLTAVIATLRKHQYIEWANHLESASTNGAHDYHICKQIADVTSLILKQNFCRYLQIKKDLKKIRKFCKKIYSGYKGSFYYLNDVVLPVSQVLKNNGHLELAEELEGGLYASQSIAECSGITRNVARQILKQKWSRKLGIKKDLKTTVKFCNSVLSAYR